MNILIEFLQILGFNSNEIKTIIFLCGAALIFYVCNIFTGRFIKYNINGIEVVKDRKLDKEHLIYKDRKIN